MKGEAGPGLSNKRRQLWEAPSADRVIQPQRRENGWKETLR